MIRFIADLPTLDFAKKEEDVYASISGIAVPWDTVATVMGGQRVAFARGSFDVNQKNAKLIEGHDLSQLRGTVPPQQLWDPASHGQTETGNFKKNQDKKAKN